MRQFYINDKYFKRPFKTKQCIDTHNTPTHPTH